MIELVIQGIVGFINTHIIRSKFIVKVNFNSNNSITEDLLLLCGILDKSPTAVVYQLITEAKAHLEASEYHDKSEKE